MSSPIEVSSLSPPRREANAGCIFADKLVFDMAPSSAASRKVNSAVRTRVSLFILEVDVRLMSSRGKKPRNRENSHFWAIPVMVCSKETTNNRSLSWYSGLMDKQEVSLIVEKVYSRHLPSVTTSEWSFLLMSTDVCSAPTPSNMRVM